jgi:mersacidin/lichenicidin family type 2 lantibiotic
MNVNTADAWKNPAYRASLSPEAIASLPANPAGATWSALDPSQVRQIVGAVVDGDANEQAESGGYICTLTTETCFCCIENN